MEAYPLQWPEGWPQTPANERNRARYEVPFSQAYRELCEELDRLGAQYIVVSSNVPLRKDGAPSMTEGRRIYDQPGVAIYYELKGKSYSIACDCWDLVKDNIRGIYYAIQAMRQLERCGASEILNRAFEGFLALPPSAESWHTVLGVEPDAPWPEIESKYKEKARRHHPDRGGDGEEMKKVNLAYLEAKKARNIE